MEQEQTHPLTMELSAAFIAQRCRDDEEFRQSFKSDPKKALGAILKERGSKLPFPPGLDLQVADNTARHWVIPIPSAEMVEAFKKSQADSFTDEEMENISAGELIVGALLITALGVGIGVVSGGVLAGGAVGLSYGLKEV